MWCRCPAFLPCICPSVCASHQPSAALKQGHLIHYIIMSSHTNLLRPPLLWHANGLEKMSGEVKGRREEGKTAIITSCQWGENVPWSASSSFFSLTLFFCLFRSLIFFFQSPLFFSSSSCNIFGTKSPSTKQSEIVADRRQSAENRSPIDSA